MTAAIGRRGQRFLFCTTGREAEKTVQRKIGIFCASEDELAPFLEHLEERKTVKKAMLEFHEGTLAGIPAAAVYGGVCKVNAAVAVQLLIDTCGATAVIDAGTAGGIDDGLEVFDTVVATETAYHDMAEDILTEYHPWMVSVWIPTDRELLEAARRGAEKLGESQRVFFGRCVSGERFIEGPEREQIQADFSPLCVDMETAAVAHVCYVNQIPFLSIRTLTDGADCGGAEDFQTNCEKSSYLSCRMALAALEEWKIEENRELDYEI